MKDRFGSIMGLLILVYIIGWSFMNGADMATRGILVAWCLIAGTGIGLWMSEYQDKWIKPKEDKTLLIDFFIWELESRVSKKYKGKTIGETTDIFLKQYYKKAKK